MGEKQSAGKLTKKQPFQQQKANQSAQQLS